MAEFFEHLQENQEAELRTRAEKHMAFTMLEPETGSCTISN